MKIMSDYREKCNHLKSIMKGYAKDNVMVAFSGGVDSSLLLKLAVEYHHSDESAVYAVTFNSMIHPTGDIEQAEKTAEEIGAQHYVLQVNELEDAGIMDNPENRCYLCKKYLFQQAVHLANKLKTPVILEGTNESDLHVYRPGITAVKELGIRSPLAEAGLNKEDVRRLAEEYGLTVANRPSKPCLATRFPYGTHITHKQMEMAEQGEAVLAAYGFYNVRLRIHGDVVRIEVDTSDFEQIMGNREQIIVKLKELGYRYITLDLEGFRSGSMDEK